MTRTPRSEKRPSTPDEVREILAEKFPPGTRATPGELRETVARLTYALGQPEQPGIYEDPRTPGLQWFSWFRPTWPLSPRKDGTYCSPIDKAQITMPGDPDTGKGAGTMFHPPSIAHQGIRALGAEEPQNDGYRIALVAYTLPRITEKEPILDALRSQAQVWLIEELVVWGRRLRAMMAARPQHISSNLSPAEQEEFARLNPDFCGGPRRVLPEEADLEYIALVEQTGPEGRRLAAALREAPPSQEEADAWKTWLPPSDGGFPARHTRLVKALWKDIVLPRLKRAAEEQRKREAPIRFPQHVGQAVTAVRNATVESSKRKAMAYGADWAEHVVVESPEVQLFIECDGQDSGNTLQTVLTGGLLKTYLLTHAVCADQSGRSLDEGMFAWDAREVYQRYLNDGKKPGGRAIELMRADMNSLLGMRVVHVDGIRMAQPEPLINMYVEERSGRKVYVHAPVISAFLRQRFSQIPRAMLRLDSRDMPLALGLATFARHNAIKILQGGDATTFPLGAVASVCGVDVQAGVKRQGGPKFWKTELARLERIAREGQIGTLTCLDAGTGQAPGEATPLHVRLHDQLASAYAPLVKTHNDRRRLAAKGRG